MDNLTNKEKEIMRLFEYLINEIGYTSCIVHEKCCDLGQVSIFKEDNKWMTNLCEGGIVFEHREYDELYNLCIHVFKNYIDKDKSRYCLHVFPKEDYFNKFNKDGYTEEDEILSCIEEEINLKFKIKDVYDFRHSHGDIHPSEYNKYSIEQYLILYKIKRLIKLNKISLKQGEKLIKLYKLQKRINDYCGRMSCERLLKDKEELTPKIEECLLLSKEIEKELNVYHLLDFKLNLEKIIDEVIINEEYPTKRKINFNEMEEKSNKIIK